MSLLLAASSSTAALQGATTGDSSASGALSVLVSLVGVTSGSSDCVANLSGGADASAPGLAALAAWLDQLNQAPSRRRKRRRRREAEALVLAAIE